MTERPIVHLDSFKPRDRQLPNRALVVSATHKPLMPCHPARARELLRKGRAAVLRHQPFTIVLKDRACGVTQPLSLKLDPGSKTTGICAVAEMKRGPKVVWAALLHHRGRAIQQSLDARRVLRRARRSRKLWYRQPRFDNRTRPMGWLPPSLTHRVLTTLTWVGRLSRWAAATHLATELVSFDTQRLQNPFIRREGYQRGTLYGYTVRRYLLQKWQGRCAYCDRNDRPLEVEHLTPRSQGGSDRISNLVLSCTPCNLKKGTQSLQQFLAENLILLKKIRAQVQDPLHDSAAVNATKAKLLRELQKTGLLVEIGDGAQTSFNRDIQGYPKAHWIDAACVGPSGARVIVPNLRPLAIICIGHGNRQMCGTNKFGFPTRHRTRQKTHFGFQTGDLVRAVVTTGKKAGSYVGRVSVRATGKFRLPMVDGLHYRFFVLIQKGDGYAYS
ncbi:HNH endonuclease [Deinococcus aerius]|uniref:HNH endonuclease n=2 Tax=Deinococcus TaxID=1298 RepID=A0A2I9DIZ2_9DEIO|nr:MULTISPECIES: RNA-guided endonuclease IscB [Deinococcus]MBB5293820.1 5-methylcytosine-specific restriction endonuclease McrA [Deinococcus metallilatus]QBY07225.1 HNH endonuclease [Deinococcus metallilatus]RXJ14697.1 HNH endonuclease [Deinococcus metallilatus]TLK30817.1 HNH endonuclease [Deinococcus metallilatus]GBF04741.1 HNH endonuclease [Deinococcus aerius]